MKSNRKLVSIVVALALVLSLIPMLALAAGNEQNANCSCTCGEESQGATDSEVIGALLRAADQEPGSSSVAKEADGNKPVGIAPEKQLFKYVMRPGDYIEGESILNDLIPGDFDIFVFVLLGSGSWIMEIEDGYFMGDTMVGAGMVHGEKVHGEATSPDIVTLGPIGVGTFAIGVVIAGYTDCPGGFPAGYYFRAWYLPLP